MTTPAADFAAAHRPFVPRCWLGNGHAMTVYTWARARMFPDVPAPERRVFRMSPDTEVMAKCLWQPQRTGTPTLVALHGLEGSSEAHYMRGLAAKAWRRGWNAVLLNQRNCGGTERLSPRLYHSGLTEDPRAVIRALVRDDRIGPVGVVGYSLGGNLTVKLASELDAEPDLPVAGVVAISPTIDLELCVHAIERRINFGYQLNFVRNLQARIARMAALWPGTYDVGSLGSVWTIRKFDEMYTAPSYGYVGASDYYEKASAIRGIDRIRVPALIIAAEDDPFVPTSQFVRPAVKRNANIAVLIERHGGHCGFAGDPLDALNDDGYWAETTALNFLASVMPRELHAP